jgi:hypothetical protein
MTWGAGSIGQVSISTLAKDLRRRLLGEDPEHPDWRVDSSNYNLEDVATKARAFLYEENYLPVFGHTEYKPSLGFLVAGYSAGGVLGEDWVINIDEQGNCPAPALLNPKDQVGMNWFGEPEAITRLVLGHSQWLPLVMQSAGLTDDQVGAVMAKAREMLSAYLFDAAMPIQDAIDLSVSLVETTIMYSRFQPGAATVGGQVEVAAITKHEHFKWVRRKHYYDPQLNVEG